MTQSQHPLLITHQADLLDEAIRIAAAAGLELSVADAPSAVTDRWSAAPLVLVGDDAAASLADRRLPRRPGVVVVCRGARADEATVWRDAVGLGAEHVAVLPDAERWLVDRLAEAAEGSPVRGQVVTVLSGRGGAGASTLTVLLARVAGARLIVDLDPLGGGIDARLGLDSAPGLRWPDLATVRGRLSASSLKGALPCLGEVAVLSASSPHAIPVDSVAAVLEAARRSGGLTLVDGPRDLSAASHVAWATSDAVVVCIPTDMGGLLSSRAIAHAVLAGGGRPIGVLRGGRDCAVSPAEAADYLGFPVVGQWGHDRELARGESPLAVPLRPLRSLADALLARDPLQTGRLAS